MEAKKRLTDMQIEELSVVKSPANKQRFLLFKGKGQDRSEHFVKLDEPLTVTIESDGTEKGTKIIVNGIKLKKIDSFSLYYSKPGEGAIEGPVVACSYSRNVESDGGFKGTENYWLTKSEGENVMFEDSLKKLSGDEAYEFVAKEISEDKNDEIQKALDTISEYQEDFTDELKKSVLTIAEYAASAIPVEKQADKTNADTDNENKDEKKTETEKSADEETKTEDDLVKSTEEILTAVKELKGAVEKSNESIKELDSRLDTVEKSTGGRKSVKANKEVEKEGGVAFPSLQEIV